MPPSWRACGRASWLRRRTPARWRRPFARCPPAPSPPPRQGEREGKENRRPPSCARGGGAWHGTAWQCTSTFCMAPLASAAASSGSTKSSVILIRKKQEESKNDASVRRATWQPREDAGRTVEGRREFFRRGERDGKGGGGGQAGAPVVGKVEGVDEVGDGVARLLGLLDDPGQLCPIHAPRELRARDPANRAHPTVSRHARADDAGGGRARGLFRPGVRT